MNDRLITALGALGALLLVYLLFLKGPGETPVSRPLSTEASRNGYLGLRTWLEREGATVLSLQERFDRLRAPELGIPVAGNLLVMTMPQHTPLRLTEPSELIAWLVNGNTVLLLAALNDTPEWSSVMDTANFIRDLGRLTGLSFRTYTEDDEESPRASTMRVPAESPLELTPIAGHPLMSGIDTLRGYSDRPSSLWSVSDETSNRLALRLAVEASTGIDAMWQLPVGAGQIVFAASGTLLSNENVAAADARRLIGNLLRYHVAPGGAVIFDDMHQGLSTLYDAAAFVRDPRLRTTALFVVAAWFLWLLGSSNRLAPPAPARTEPRQSDFLAAAGGFMARRLAPRAAGLLLFDEWFAEVRRARDLPPRDEPPWDELAATPALQQSAYRELRDDYERLQSGRPVNLVRLHNSLRHAREAIG